MDMFLKSILAILKRLIGKTPESKSEIVSMPPKNPTKINAEGLKLIKDFEGLRLEAYLDAVNIPTIGYGHTGPEVKLGQKITEQEAEDLLKKDVERFEKGVHDAITVQVGENQFSAMVCFAYNVGLGNLKQSTLLKCLNKLNYRDAAEEFLRWNKAGGVVLAGLTRRRKAERDLFLKDSIYP